MSLSLLPRGLRPLTSRLTSSLSPATSNVRFLHTSRPVWEDKGDDSEPTKDKEVPNPNLAKQKLKDMMAAVKKDQTVKSEPLNLKKPQKPQKKVSGKGLPSNLAEAASDVAEHIGGDDKAKVQKTQSDLLKQLKKTSEAINAKSVDISALMSSMKVDKRKPKVDNDMMYASKGFKRELNLSEAQQQFLRERKLKRSRQGKSEEDDRDVVIVESDFRKVPPLGVFSTGEKIEVKEEESTLPVWSACKERERRILRKPLPKNFLEEMNVWTEKGILWHFPIDNEQGIEESDMEPFHAHVFLERHLDPWCPPSGPVRHFMELVCVGLQRNPFITADAKVSHINWYRAYFEDEERNEVLKLAGAVDS